MKIIMMIIKNNQDWFLCCGILKKCTILCANILARLTLSGNIRGLCSNKCHLWSFGFLRATNKERRTLKKSKWVNKDKKVRERDVSRKDNTNLKCNAKEKEKWERCVYLGFVCIIWVFVVLCCVVFCWLIQSHLFPLSLSLGPSKKRVSTFTIMPQGLFSKLIVIPTQMIHPSYFL